MLMAKDLSQTQFQAEAETKKNSQNKVRGVKGVGRASVRTRDSVVRWRCRC